MAASTIPVTFSTRCVTIACTDRRRTESFYRDVLGAEPILGEGYGCPSFRLGSLVLSVMPNAEHPSPGVFPEHAMPMLWLEVDDVRLAHQHLEQQQVTIIQAPEDDLCMLVADPDGLVIEIWQQDEERDGL